MDEMFLRNIKSMGFSDKRISEITQISIQKFMNLDQNLMFSIL